MRCYFMRKGRIAAVEMLEPGPDDSLIDQAQAHFKKHGAVAYEGFEVWDHARRVYTWPDDAALPSARPT